APAAAFIKGFDQLAPSLALAVIDLAEVQHLPLHHLATGAALVLDNIPVAMLFAVFEASVVSQENDADDARLIRVIEKRCKVYTTADLRSAAVDPTRLFRLARPEKRCCPQRVGKIGLDLQLALGTALRAAKGFSAPEVGSTYARARALAEQIDRPDYLGRVFFGQWLFHRNRGEYKLALALAEQMEKIGEAHNDVSVQLMGRWASGKTRLRLGE